MDKIIALCAFIFLSIFFSLTINASSIEYNDLTVNDNFILSAENFDALNLKIDGQDIDFNQVTIISQDNDSISMNISVNDVVYNFIVSLTRFENSQTISGLNRSLEINDDSAVDSSNISDILCVVRSQSTEVIDVNLIKNSQEDGITDATLTCDSQNINYTSELNTVNTNENSVYTISQDNILYAENFKYNIDKIDELTDQDILELANAQSTLNQITVSSINENTINLTSANMSINIEIQEDEPPILNKKPYYNLNYNSSYDLYNIFDVTDDSENLPEIEINLDEDVGIYQKQITITDENDNEVSEDVLVIINDGRYVVTDDELYIIDTTDNIYNNDIKNTLEAYNINSNTYENVDYSILTFDTEDYQFSNQDVENSYEDSENNQVNKIIYITIFFILFIILILVIFV